MNFKTYLAYIGECKNLGSAEALLGEIGFPPDMTLTADSLVTATKIIAAVGNNNIAALIELSGLNMAAFSRKYLIPYRTVQDWVSGVRTTTEYVTMLIGWELITELEKTEYQRRITLYTRYEDGYEYEFNEDDTELSSRGFEFNDTDGHGKIVHMHMYVE